MINIIFYTCYSGDFTYYKQKNKDFDFIKANASKFRLTNFSKFTIEGLFKDYFNKLRNGVFDELGNEDIQNNFEFANEILLPFYRNSEKIESIVDKEICKKFILIF